MNIDKQYEIVSKIIKKKPLAAEALVRIGYSRRIETALIRALIASSGRGFSVPTQKNHYEKDLSSLKFTHVDFPNGVLFNFSIYGGGYAVYLNMYARPNNHPSTSRKMLSIAKEHPAIFKHAGGQKNWHTYYYDEFITDEDGLSVEGRIEKIIQKWHEFLSKDFPTIRRLIKKA